jgi:hypothetical protein
MYNQITSAYSITKCNGACLNKKNKIKNPERMLKTDIRNIWEW